MVVFGAACSKPSTSSKIGEYVGTSFLVAWYDAAADAGVAVAVVGPDIAEHVHEERVDRRKHLVSGRRVGPVAGVRGT